MDSINTNNTMHISVIMAVYNAEATVAQAVRSIQNQTYGDWDLVIVDDGSTDGGWAILQDLARNDPRITLRSNGRNCGLAATLNHALRYARGPLIARMDADDLSLPQRFEKQVSFLREHPEVDVLGTSAYILEDDGIHTRPLDRTLPTTHAEIVSVIYKTNPLIHASIMARKKFYDGLCGYNSRYRKAEDYDLWLRGYRHFVYANLPEPLYSFKPTQSDSFYNALLNFSIIIRESHSDKKLLKNSFYAFKHIVHYCFYKYCPQVWANYFKKHYSRLGIDFKK